jgi:MoaA/NifB/PqqE/SkfB family radical SAM enzyme
MKDDPVGTGPPVDAAAFEKMRRIARGLGEARRALVEGGPRTADLPEEVAFKLTNRCDLRCAHCYQWNDGGYHRGLAPGAKGGDLDLAIVERVLEATRVRKSNVILWGGEPLVYRHWDGLVELLAEDPR